MSDSGTQPPKNPYGDDPYGQDQPGQNQPPYGQPPAQQNPYGAGEQPTPYGQAPYGQAPYGQQPYGAYGGASHTPDKRPATVTVAAVVTLVCSVLSVGFFGIMAVILGAMSTQAGLVQDLEDQLAADPSFRELGWDVSDLANMMVGIFIFLALLCLIGVLLGALAFKRSKAVRVLLVIWCALIALVSLASIGTGISILPLLASVAVIVLLFVGGANEWYAGRRAEQSYGGEYPPGY